MSDLNEMAVFERVAREGGFTAAAHALGISKASVSQKISRLEQRLGARLLQRTTRKVSLTEVGATYYERCARILADVREADAAVSASHEVPQGVLRVTAPRLFGDAFLTPLVTMYLRQYPDASVELLLTERRVDLIEEGFDLAVRIGALRDAQLIARLLGRARSIYCASPGYLEARGVPEAPDALAGHACVVVAHGRRTEWPFAGPRGPEALAVEGRFAVNSLVMGRDLAIRGAGIAYLPAFLCTEALARGALCQLLDAHSPPAYPIYAIYPSSRHLSAKVRAFLDLLAGQAASDAPWA